MIILAGDIGGTHRRDDAGGRGGLFRAPAARHAALLASDRQIGAKAGAGERRRQAKGRPREALT